MNGKGKGTAIFIASACVSLVVLGALLLLFMLYMKAARAEAVKHDVAEQTAYHPADSESLTVVLLGCHKAESLPEVVALFSYDAPSGVLSVVGIPPNAVCTLNGRTDTLAGHYDYEGVRGAVKAVGELLGLQVDRYLRTQQTGLANLVDFLGGLEYDTEGTGERRLLDGRQTVELLFGRTESGLPDAPRQTELGRLLLDQRFSPPLAEKYEAFSQAVFYNCETNLSQYDFVLRKKGLLTYLERDCLLVKGAALEGRLDTGSDRFFPDEESAEKIAAMLAGEAA